MSDDDRNDLSPFLEALDMAHEAQTRYDTARQLAAKGLEANAEAERVRFQQLVIDFWRRMRPYIRTELPQYWEQVTLYEDDDGVINGLKQLHHYQGAVQTNTSFGADDEIQSSTEPVLLPPVAVRNALAYLTECAHRLGFMPDAQTGRSIGNVDVFKAGEDGDPNELMRNSSEDEQDTDASRA
jgi:hypothetical protein